jgi:hypothetical protein
VSSSTGIVNSSLYTSLPIDRSMLVVTSPPIAAKVHVIGEFVASEIRGRPGLVYVFTLPDVGEGVHFEWSKYPHGSKIIGRVFEGV